MDPRDAIVVTMDSFERLLWWLFAGSAGARTRALVLFDLRDQPKNAQQLSQSLHLDYTTVRHHLRVLETNKVVLAEGDKYGRVYFVSGDDGVALADARRHPEARARGVEGTERL